ncbi:hypothetical protein PHMEG_0004809 [Phytophthora megakarya]|uniref:Retrotransposon gag domain-containing protein n=1 Tax=Phytophthora megakarya TaxID=4795 RepID=A0A225WUK5_9STRA|nr:hypothetical protein PHMEG_0004809 [Phytophthora megakarya]
MQWLRTFIYEMKGTHTPPNDWCMALEVRLQDGALHWYRQLPRKTRRTWKLLSVAFIKYYCSKFSQSAKARCYSAKREDKEHVCDYLNRLNGYARNAGVQFENGGREAKSAVEHFLDTCDDRGLEERLCHVRVKVIHDLEDINDILKRRDLKTKRDSSVRRSSGQDGGRRRDSSRIEDSRSSYHRDSHYRVDRRRDESPYRPRITLADALSDLVTASNETSVGPQTSQSGSYDHGCKPNEDSFGDGERRDDEDRYTNGGSEYDYTGENERGHVAAANDLERRAAAEGMFARSDNRRSKGDGHFNNDRGFARDNRNGRQQYGPSRQLKLGWFLSDYHSWLNPRKTQTICLPLQGRGFVNTTGIAEGNDGSLVENEVDGLDVGDYDEHLTQASASSREPNEASSRSLVRTAKLLPGERLGWWSSQRYNKRTRMRAVLMGAIDDTRTSILLDTEANVSVILAAYAKRLHLREVPDHGRSLEVRGINPGVLETRRRTLVKITLGWERVYEFEM